MARSARLTTLSLLMSAFGFHFASPTLLQYFAFYWLFNNLPENLINSQTVNPIAKERKNA